MPIPPGPSLPRFAQTLAWLTRPGPYMERARDRYGDTFTIRIAQEGTWVLMSDPEAVRQIFKGDPSKLHAGEANVILRPILGPSSVLTLDDAPHMRQRKLLLPPFHGERMKRYGELMTEIAEAEVASWPRGEMTLMPRTQALTMEIILRAVFGMEAGAGMDRMREALTRMMDWTTRPSRFVAMATFGPARIERSGLFQRAMDPVDRLLLEEIARRREDPDLESREDILSMLLLARHEDGSPMGDRELRDELLTLLVAGHETTATSLAWAVERLIRHPDAWERLRSGDDAYLDATVKETLRLRPVLPLVVRMLKEPMEIGGWELPAGVTVAPCIYLMHRRPDIYPDPYAFRPERFLETPAGTYTWIPFGGGIRRCLGASFAMFEMSAVLRVIAERAELRPVRPERERVRRRAIMFTPHRQGEVVAAPREPAGAAAQRELAAA